MVERLSFEKLEIHEAACAGCPWTAEIGDQDLIVINRISDHPINFPF
jgi:hypothetical protein